MHVTSLSPEPPSIADRPAAEIARLLTEANRLLAIWHRDGAKTCDATRWFAFLRLNFRIHELSMKIQGDRVYIWTDHPGVDIPMIIEKDGGAAFDVNDGSHIIA